MQTSILGNFFGLLLFLYPCDVYSSLPYGIIRNFSYPVSSDFSVIWNIPSYKCKTHGFNFEPMLRSAGILVNSNDNFRGEVIIILYDPGMFPVLLKNPVTNQTIPLNGGGPHNGNLTAHLKAFEETIEKIVPQNFQGLGILDFETWRPIFRQNWNEQVVYRELVIEHVKNKSSTLDKKRLMDAAKQLFETTARSFIEQTLIKVKKMRPSASWGYYGYPYCLNYGSNGDYECPQMVKDENDELKWLFSISDTLYPSLYTSINRNDTDYVKFLVGRFNEMWRIISSVSPTKLIYTAPYFWYRYIDSYNFLNKEKIYNTLILGMFYQTGGLIIWGSSKDLETKSQCKDLYDFMKDKFGPILQEAKADFLKNKLVLK